MTAKEMFEKLGYKQINSEDCIEYIDRKQNEICFWLGRGFVTSENILGDVRGIRKDELKAVVAQAKELRWLDE